MSTITGTINSVHLLSSNIGGTMEASFPRRSLYALSCSFATYTGSSDSAQLTGVEAAIAAATKMGRTVYLRDAMGGQPGADANAQAVYASSQITCTGAGSTSGGVGGTMAFNLTTAGGTEMTGAAASLNVQIVACVDEVG